MQSSATQQKHAKYTFSAERYPASTNPGYKTTWKINIQESCNTFRQSGVCCVLATIPGSTEVCGSLGTSVSILIHTPSKMQRTSGLPLPWQAKFYLDLKINGYNVHLCYTRMTIEALTSSRRTIQDDTLRRLNPHFFIIFRMSQWQLNRFLNQTYNSKIFIYQYVMEHPVNNNNA